jgi:hypothetical protein
MLLARSLCVAASAPPRAVLRRVAVLSNHLAAGRAAASQQRPQRALRLVRVRSQRRALHTRVAPHR